MRLLLLGGPGAGKGTQARPIAAKFGLTHLSSGDMLRREVALGTPTGLAARGYMDRGDLVPDDVIIGMLVQPMTDAARDHGYVLDGYPRTVPQAEHGYDVGRPLDIHVQVVVYLSVPTAELVRRLLARARGVDDTRDVIANRIRVFERDTIPLLDYFTTRGEKVIEIDGTRPVEVVTAAILRELQPLA
jgi:adenylate kinase